MGRCRLAGLGAEGGERPGECGSPVRAPGDNLGLRPWRLTRLPSALVKRLSVAHVGSNSVVEPETRTEQAACKPRARRGRKAKQYGKP